MVLVLVGVHFYSTATTTATATASAAVGVVVTGSVVGGEGIVRWVGWCWLQGEDGLSIEAHSQQHGVVWRGEDAHTEAGGAVVMNGAEAGKEGIDWVG